MHNPNEELVKCPKCKHIFNYAETFWWGLDYNRDPTVENIFCPKCNASTSPYDKRKKQYRFEDFTDLNDI